MSVIVTCSSGLTLYFAADWSVAQHSCAYDPMGVQTFKRSTFNVQRSASVGMPRHRYYYRPISDAVAMCGLKMCEYNAVNVTTRVRINA